jgi:hypothetical protein
MESQLEGTMFETPKPRLDPMEDNPRLDAALGRVLDLMRDGRAHTIREIRDVGGSSGDRRVRELRDLGYTITVRRVVGGGGEHLYTLVKPRG